MLSHRSVEEMLEGRKGNEYLEVLRERIGEKESLKRACDRISDSQSTIWWDS